MKRGEEEHVDEKGDDLPSVNLFTILYEFPWWRSLFKAG